MATETCSAMLRNLSSSGAVSEAGFFFMPPFMGRGLDASLSEFGIYKVGSKGYCCPFPALHAGCYCFFFLSDTVLASRRGINEGTAVLGFCCGFGGCKNCIEQISILCFSPGN